MRRKRKNNYIIILVVAIVLIGLALFSVHNVHHRTKVTTNTSYQVNETATLNKSTQLYSSLKASKSTTLSASTTVKVKKYYLVTADDQKTTYAQVSLNGKNYYVKAKNLALTMNNSVNKYIAQLGYPHAKITKKIYKQFEKRSYKTTSGKPKGVVIHDTGTDYSTLSGEVNYMEQNYKTDDVFVHTFVDASQILNIANTKYMAQGAGPKANPYYVQFEMPHEYSAKGFATQTANAAYYTAYILRKNNLPVTKGTKSGSGTVWTHDMVSNYLGGTDHEDPTSYWEDTAEQYFGSSYNINDFIELVQAYYNQLGSTNN